MNDITALVSVQKSANLHRLSRLIAYAPNDELRQMAVEVEQYTNRLLGALEHYKSRDARVTKLVLDNSVSWEELFKQLEEAKQRNAELVEALEKAHRQIAQVTAERDALREGEIGNAKHSNTRAAADIYFQLAEECDIPAGGSLVEFVDGLKERLCVLESRTVTVKLPAEYLNADGSVNADMANTCPVVSAYREAHRAAGIQVIEGEGK